MAIGELGPLPARDDDSATIPDVLSELGPQTQIVVLCKIWVNKDDCTWVEEWYRGYCIGGGLVTLENKRPWLKSTL